MQQFHELACIKNMRIHLFGKLAMTKMKTVRKSLNVYHEKIEEMMLQPAARISLKESLIRKVCNFL